MAFLEIQNAGKLFTSDNGTKYEALRGVNLQIEEGQFISIIGHSGCGKSTVLNMVAGLGMATSGRIVVDGTLVTGPGPDRMVAFQNHSLLPWLTVRQNIALAVNAVHNELSEVDRNALVEEHIKLVSLEKAADKKPGQISGGMRQRVGIARALSTRPKVLLLDEPFGALDALTRGRLQEELARIWEAHRITVIMITHDVDEALLLSDRIVMMTNGPAAKVGDIMTVELPHPRKRMEVVNNPNYYRQRNELIDYLQKAKQAKKAAPAKPVSVPSGTSSLEKTTVSLGFVPLLDCAPLVIAKEKGFFEKYGLDVNLSREVSWKALLQGVLGDRLDAAMMVCGMPVGETLGVYKKPSTALVTALTLSRNGNAITLSSKYYEKGVRTREDFANYLKEDKSGKPHTLGMTFPSSMHNLLLRYWLAGAGIDPEKDVNLVVIPPPQMVSNLQAGNIGGFCVGDPWNSRAIHEGLGFAPATDMDIYPGHPEKVLGLKETWADAYPKTHLALVKALIEACRYCDQPENREEVIQLVCQKQYVNADPIYGAVSLRDRFDYGFGRTETVSNFNLFSQHQSGFTEQLWSLTQMARWGLVPFPKNYQAVLSRVYRSEIYGRACTELGLVVTSDAPTSLTLPDGSVFDSADPLGYLESLAIKQPIEVAEIKLPAHLLTIV
ncbi:MAG: ABC transporter substrate-binding protein [Anaerolineae bacterium]|nr:ABC transporter substrate-binding protein [Gloeobacterales cyanobacterium ES-bin-313]